MIAVDEQNRVKLSRKAVIAEESGGEGEAAPVAGSRYEDDDED